MTLDPDDPLTVISGQTIAGAITAHRVLGPGLFESVYQRCLEYELADRKIKFRRQVAVPLEYRGVRIDCGFRLDFLVEDQLIVEVKAVDHLAPIHYAQMITYLKLTGCRAGLLLNFNVTSMKQGIRRVTNRFLADEITAEDDLGPFAME